MAELTEERLRAAVLRVDEYQLDRLRARTEPPHLFSHRFERKMAALLRQSERTPRMRVVATAVKRAAILLLALLTVSTSTVVSVKALRERVFQWLMEAYSTHTDVWFEETSPSGEAPGAFRPCAPTYLPEGFEWANAEEYEEGLEYEFLRLIYKNKDGARIIYEQTRPEGLVMDFNTEGATLEEIIVKNRKGYYISNLGVQMVAWLDGNYIYSVTSDLDKESVLKIAESTKYADF